jgi:hypothetical protein
MPSPWTKYRKIPDFVGEHEWLVGDQWLNYGDYFYRDDECRCGCFRRVAVNDHGDEVVDFYVKDNYFTIKQPVCVIRNMIDVTIIADPTEPEKCSFRFNLNKPQKIDYFDLYNQ